ncbi:MAG: hypothetical protein KJ645_03160 [Planctomycetes bacterium]|nr:hypothetical protein [Planctomycetota bacterium]
MEIDLRDGGDGAVADGKDFDMIGIDGPVLKLFIRKTAHRFLGSIMINKAISYEELPGVRFCA